MDPRRSLLLAAAAAEKLLKSSTIIYVRSSYGNFFLLLDVLIFRSGVLATLVICLDFSGG